MTKRRKRILFYSAVLIFLLLSYAVILYAQGYKYSLSEGKFLRTGTIAVKTNIGARVILNDKLEGSTSFFNNSFSIDRLLPGKYALSVSKDNYSSWSKTVNVEEGLVSDFPHILLLPQKDEERTDLLKEIELLFSDIEPMPTLIPTPAIKKQLKPTSTPIEDNEIFVLDVKNKKLLQTIDEERVELAKNVLGFRLSENENKIAWWTANELWVLWLNDQNYQPFYKKGDKELITRFQSTIQKGIWYEGEDHLILEIEQLDSKKRPYTIHKLVEIDKRGGVNIIEL